LSKPTEIGGFEKKTPVQSGLRIFKHFSIYFFIKMILSMLQMSIFFSKNSDFNVTQYITLDGAAIFLLFKPSP
jgi:hypothetical protein